MRFTSLFTLTALLYTEVAYGHGGMNFPATRNLVHSNYCPHCANGKGVCGNGSGSQWTSSDLPALLHGEYETDRTVLYTGGTVEVELWFTVGHYGVLTVELCSNPGETITSDCFKRLQRDPTDERISPYLPEFPEIVFLLTNDCIVRATLNSPAKIRFLVPDGMAPSDHAILRMYWNTGNSCSPHPASTTSTVDSRVSNFETLFNGASCGVAVSGLNLCGSDCPRDECSGEKFINCADVAVLVGNTANHVTVEDHEQIAIGETATGASSRAPPAPVTATTTTKLTTPVPTKPTTIAINPTNPQTTPARSPVATSAAAVLSTTTTTSATPPKTCAAPSGNVETCKTHIKAHQSWYDDYCEERCQTLSSGEDATGRQWCSIKSICDLTDCVAQFYSHVCRRV